MYQVAHKVGIGSYWDEDGCDEIVAEVPGKDIPRVGDVLDLQCLNDPKHSRKSYLVREVKRSINFKPYGEFIKVYVIDL